MRLISYPAVDESLQKKFQRFRARSLRQILLSEHIMGIMYRYFKSYINKVGKFKLKDE